MIGFTLIIWGLFREIEYQDLNYVTTIPMSKTICGDKICEGDEDCASCAPDCGVCPATTTVSITTTFMETTTTPTLLSVITELFTPPTKEPEPPIPSITSTTTTTPIIASDHSLEIYLIGDYSSSDEYSEISIEDNSIGNADTSRQCQSSYELGLKQTIEAADFRTYCSDGIIEITFFDSWGVNCCCNSQHKACIDDNCCEVLCAGKSCTNSVYFNCVDLSCA